MRRINGKCHCGNISYEFLWPEPGSRIPVRACSCTFCTKHGGVYTSHPEEVTKADPEKSTASYGVRLISAADFIPEAIDWAWDGYLATGKVHLIGGKPGQGKTTCAIALASVITRGGEWPDSGLHPGTGETTRRLRRERPSLRR